MKYLILAVIAFLFVSLFGHGIIYSKSLAYNSSEDTQGAFFNPDSTSRKIERKDTVYAYAPQMPHPPYNVTEFIETRVHTPEGAKRKRGRVWLQFVVLEDGELSDFVVARGLTPACDSEALRVARKLPKWNPGRKDGVTVKIGMVLPIDFPRW